MTEIYRLILHNGKRKKEINVIKYTRAAEVERQRIKGTALTLSSSGHGMKALGHSLLSLGMLFIGISQSSFSLLRPAKCSFLRLLSSHLSSSHNIISFSRSIELRL
jgi:hypothetical protein